MKLVSVLVLSAFVFSISLPARTLSVLSVSLEQLSSRSELIFEGEVVSVESTLDPDQTGIITYVTFRVDDVIKGEYREEELVLRFLGGKVGEVELSVSDSTFPVVKESGIYFVESLSRFLVNPFYGMDQGHFLIHSETSGQRVMMTRGKKMITGFTADESEVESRISNGIARGLTINEGGLPLPSVTVLEFKQRVHQYKNN